MRKAVPAELVADGSTNLESLANEILEPAHPNPVFLAYSAR